MFLKEELVLPAGEVLTPEQETYIRIGQVIKVSLFSREMTVIFVDGDHDGSENLEEPVTAIAVVGSDDPSTTYAPSAAVYGCGDLCNIMVMPDGFTLWAVSVLDNFENSNRENFALIKGWALFDVLNGLLLDILDDEDSSYLEFYDPSTELVTQIEGDPTKRHVMRRMLDFFKGELQNTMSYAQIDSTYRDLEKLGGGPQINPPRVINGVKYFGRFVSGFPYVEDLLYGQSDLTGNLTSYHPTLTYLDTGSTHPNAGTTEHMIFRGSHIIWFGDDDPEYAVVIGTFPAWASCKQIKFLEVPVYSLCGRKLLERDEDDEIVWSWSLYADQVRELKTINRNYINWTAHGDSLLHSQRVDRALPVYSKPPDSGVVKFGFIDGYGFDQSGNIYNPDKLRKVIGTITRTEMDPEDESAVNGSRFEYAISNNDPNTTGVVDNWYSTRYEYFDDNTDQWERQTMNSTTKEFPMFTNGDDEVYKLVDFDFYAEGNYGSFGTGNEWDDYGDGFIADATYILNDLYQYVYVNDVLLFTDHYSFRYEDSWAYADMTYYYFHYFDIEFDLFVLERVIVDLDGEQGPADDCTGTIKRQGIVIFEGTEYVIWTVTKTMTTFPSMWNYWPWLLDGGNPERPETATYDVDTNYNGVFYWPPFYDYYMDANTNYEASARGYPSDDICGKLFVHVRDITDDTQITKSSDYLQVSIDRDSDSFVVRFPCFLDTSPSAISLSYPNTGDTLFSFNGETPHFTKPAVGNIITL